MRVTYPHASHALVTRTCQPCASQAPAHVDASTRRQRPCTPGTPPSPPAHAHASRPHPHHPRTPAAPHPHTPAARILTSVQVHSTAHRSQLSPTNASEPVIDLMRSGNPPWASRGIIDRRKARAMGPAPHFFPSFPASMFSRDRRDIGHFVLACCHLPHWTSGYRVTWQPVRRPRHVSAGY